MKRTTDHPAEVAGLIGPKRIRTQGTSKTDHVKERVFVDNNDNISAKSIVMNSTTNAAKCSKTTANARKERNESMESSISMSTFIANNLSEKAKFALLKLEKNKTKDPFNEENQMLISEFTTQATQQSIQDVSLAEAGVLLDGVGQVYSRQVKRLHSDVLALATFCTTTSKPKPKEGNKEKDDANKKNQDGVENDEANVGSQVTEQTGEDAATNMVDDNTPQPVPVEANTEEPAPEDKKLNGSADSIFVENETQCEGSSNPADGVPRVPTEEEQNAFLQSLILDPGSINLDGENGDKIGLEFNPTDLVTSTPTKDKNDRIGPSSGTRGAKKCSITDLLKDHSFFKALGITLQAENKSVSNPRIKVPKLVPFYEIPFVESAEDDGPPPLESSILPERPKMTKVTKICDMTTDINKNLVLSQVQPAESVTLKSLVPEGVLYEGDKAKTDSVFKPEDLDCIHKFIQQLHYLSLTTEVSANRKEGMFKNAVDQLQKIFLTYNLSNPGATASSSEAGESDQTSASARNEVASTSSSTPIPSSSNSTFSLDSTLGSSPASTPCPGSRKSSTEEEEGDLNLDLESMHESFSESFDEESTVMQRTKEKSRKESRHRLQEALVTILSPIVKKHSIKPLIEEHNPAFFRKVESFQSKMKKILEEEKEKDQFNLTTYEQELLEVANKDIDSDDGSQVATPVSKVHDTNELDYISKDFAEPQSPCRSETSSNSSGLKWIKLENLFAHVKNQDRREAARYFCAMLGLLSFENLDVNYDRLYDEKSAKKVKKSLDCSQDQKYPRGAKIVRSRCPDVNEVFVTPLSAVSRTEVFRQHEYGVSEDDIKKMQRAEFLEATGAQAAFEQVQGKIYTGELFSKRSRAIQARKLQKAQAQAQKDIVSQVSPEK